METTDLGESLADDIIARFDNGPDLGIMPNNEIFPQDNLFMGDAEEDNEADDIIILHMDIREPLSTLRTLLEQKIGVDLKKYKFWLQDAQMLEPHKNLVDQCVKGEGLVQINAQIQTISERINIVDVLKPTEAALAALEALKADENKNGDEDNDDSTTPFDENTNSNAVSMEDESDRDDHVINWVLDNKFKKDQARLKIPDDPNEWTSAQVKHWLQWAVRQFNLTQIKLNDWNINGKELCSLSLEDFQQKVPNDPGNVFWTHLELLRKCKFVAIIQKFTDGDDDMSEDVPTILRKHPRAIKRPVTAIMKQYGNFTVNQWETSGNRSGNNGQIQLWQFLLDILTDREHRSIIQWVGHDGEFKLSDPEKVAQLWGDRKNKPAMNYEKLSRALRYYYDGDMISKVHGKRFVYKFVCDLKQLIGYDANELASLVNQVEAPNFYDDFVLN